jgi:sugar O-acyltransferase (sialic acid O-acetyltransferase NeuD family)
MSSDLILMGSGGHAKVVLEAILARNPDCHVTILDDDPGAADRLVLGIKVSGTREWLSSNAPDVAVALGIGDNGARLSLHDWLIANGRTVETVIHPSAIVGASVEIDAGAFLAAGSVAIAEAKIGSAAILNTACSVDHDCVIGVGAHIGPGARLCGNVHVGARSMIGVGSAVRPGVRIGSDVILGAGSAVVADIPDGGIYAGCPARPLKSDL